MATRLMHGINNNKEGKRKRSTVWYVVHQARAGGDIMARFEFKAIFHNV